MGWASGAGLAERKSEKCRIFGGLNQKNAMNIAMKNPLKKSHWNSNKIPRKSHELTSQENPISIPRKSHEIPIESHEIPIESHEFQLCPWLHQLMERERAGVRRERVTSTPLGW